MVPQGNDRVGGKIPDSKNLSLQCTEPLLDQVTPEVEPIHDRTEYTFYAGETLMLSWEVGGSFYVNDTHVVVAKWPKDSSLDIDKPGFGWSESQLESSLDIIQKTLPLKGPTRWAGGGLFGSPSSTEFSTLFRGGDLKLQPNPVLNDREIYPILPAWKGCINIPDSFNEESNEYVVFIVSTVDQGWKKSTSSMLPQSHLVNARTNSSWKMENNGHVVEGRLKWYSRPIKIKAIQRRDKDSVSKASGDVNQSLASPGAVDLDEYEYEGASFDEDSYMEQPKPTKNDGAKPYLLTTTFFSRSDSFYTVVASGIVGVMLAALLVFLCHCISSTCRSSSVQYEKLDLS
mmetsp:Transcript_8488/g.10190  ORF Transcript_8488/g.10190 Transcript_8488/m.10190 type:complete len:344 (-) Transcript_8488:996-2027(-)